MRTLTVSVVKNGRFEFEEILDVDAHAQGDGADGAPLGGAAADGAAQTEPAL